MLTSAILSTRRALRLVSLQPAPLSASFSTSKRILTPDDAGAVAQSKEFKQREQSEEMRYIREKEADELKKIRSELNEQKKKIEELEKNIKKSKN